MNRTPILLGAAAVIALGVSLHEAGAYALLGNKWLDPRMPVEYQFNTVLDETCIAGQDEFDEVRAAFQVWEDVAGVNITFGEQGSTTTACGLQVDGQNTMSMEDCLNQCTGSCIAVTSSVAWGNGGDPTWVVNGGVDQAQAGKTESDITFSKSWRFGTFEDVGSGCTSDNCPAGQTFDIRGIAVHEIGHLIGLGHSSVSGATMFASASFCSVALTSLAPDDMNGARVLYDETYVPFDLQDVTGGNVVATLLNAGNIGASGSGGPVAGEYGSGFQYPIGTQNLYEAALVFGTGSADPVSGDYRVAGAIGQDNDFFQTTPVSFSTSGPSDEVAQATFADGKGENPYGISVTASMHAWTAAPNDDFVVVCYTLRNESGAAINGLRVGLLMDWDFNDVFASNSVEWNAVDEVGVLSDPSTTRVAGIAVLNTEGAQTFRGLTSADPYSEITTAEYLFDGFTSTDVTNNDVNLLIATGDYNIPSGGSVNAAFVLAGGTSEADLLANVAQARAVYAGDELCATVVGVDESAGIVPTPNRLAQNVPNPFNPRTSISFELDRAGVVLLEVYEPSGRRVKTLVRGVRDTGPHVVTWDGTDDFGQEVPSGMYFYTLRAAGQTVSRKMTLLK
jgi:hypothetical protein